MTRAHIDGASRPGDASFARHLGRLFECDPEFLGEPIDGRIGVVRYRHNGIASVASLGLERVDLPGAARIELLCEVVEPQKAAAEIAVRIAVQRVLGLLGDEPGPMRPGDVWINSVPFLAGTRIQGLVAVDAQWSGRDQTVRGDDGEPVGWINEIVMLTKNEAKRVATDGIVPLLEAATASPTLRFDVLRDDMVEPPTTMPRVPCVVSHAALELGVRWLQRDDEGTFLAIALTESPEDLADAASFSTRTLAEVVVGSPDLRGFAVRARPGEYAMHDGAAWSFGALADVSATDARERRSRDGTDA